MSNKVNRFFAAKSEIFCGCLSKKVSRDWVLCKQKIRSTAQTQCVWSLCDFRLSIPVVSKKITAHLGWLNSVSRDWVLCKQKIRSTAQTQCVWSLCDFRLSIPVVSKKITAHLGWLKSVSRDWVQVHSAEST